MCKDGECGDNSPIATLANLTPETCFIDPESGVQICKWSDVDKHNNTDAHRENGEPIPVVSICHSSQYRCRPSPN